jgi:hypothetical protein
MEALAFWRAVTADHSDFLGTFVGLLEEHAVRYCVVGGQAVNAYVEPLVSLDLALALAMGEVERIEPLLSREFQVERFPHSLNLALEGSKLRVQLQTDPRCHDFAVRAAKREVLGVFLPVASLEDVLQGKVWAATDSTRRPSKRRKDLLDIERIIEAYPNLRSGVPSAILQALAQSIDGHE